MHRSAPGRRAQTPIKEIAIPEPGIPLKTVPGDDVACPFCAASPGEPEPIPAGGGHWAIPCPKCGTSGPPGLTPDEARQLWNKRVLTAGFQPD